jgi:hypothetical protein
MVAKRDDAEAFPHLLIYPHSDADPEEVDRELELLRDEIRREKLRMQREREEALEPFIPDLKQKFFPAWIHKSGTNPYCDVEGHCFNTPQALGGHVATTGHHVADGSAHTPGFLPFQERTEPLQSSKVQLPPVKSWHQFAALDEQTQRDAIWELGIDKDKFFDMSDSDKRDLLELYLRENFGVDPDEAHLSPEKQATRRIQLLQAGIDWSKVEKAGRKVVVGADAQVSSLREKLQKKHRSREPWMDLTQIHPVAPSASAYTKGIHGWANDSVDPDSAPLWMWASKRFNNYHMPKDDLILEKYKGFTPKHAKDIEESVALTQEIVRRIDPSYDAETDTIELYRGIKDEMSKELQDIMAGGLTDDDRIVVKHRALESWSASPEVAERFGDVILHARVPVSSLVAAFYTNSRFLSTEAEYLVGTPDGQAAYNVHNLYLRSPDPTQRGVNGVMHQRTFKQWLDHTDNMRFTEANTSGFSWDERVELENEARIMADYAVRRNYDPEKAKQYFEHQLRNTMDVSLPKQLLQDENFERAAKYLSQHALATYHSEMEAKLEDDRTYVVYNPDSSTFRSWAKASFLSMVGDDQEKKREYAEKFAEQLSVIAVNSKHLTHRTLVSLGEQNLRLLGRDIGPVVKESEMKAAQRLARLLASRFDGGEKKDG